MNFYRQKLVCMARCKNEIHVIKKWIESMPFVDVFVIIDNNSTDGTYKYLKSLENAIVIRLEKFDEGRDFQILLKIAKALEPEWLLKLDCDEIFEDIAIKNFHKLLEQKKYNTFLFRRYNFDYRLVSNEHWITKNDSIVNPLLSLVKNKKEIDILNIKSHVGSMMFSNKLALSNFRIKHFSKPSPQKALEKCKTYMSMSSKKDHRKYKTALDQSEEYINSHRRGIFEKLEQKPLYPLDTYGIPTYKFNGENFNIIQAKNNKKYFKNLVKEMAIKIINLSKINKIILFILAKKKIGDR